MENRFFYILLLFAAGNFGPAGPQGGFADSNAPAGKIADLNGTYVYLEGHLESPSIHEWDFSWGRGLTITETSIEFDLGEKTVMIPGMGLYFIGTAFKDPEGAICLELFYVSDKERASPMNMKVSFIDSQRVFIVHDSWERWGDKSYSPEAKWIWYRLSGPAD